MRIRRQTTVSEQVYRELRRQIDKGELADGQRIEARIKLAGTKTMPVGHGSLNTALVRLRDEGRVEAHKGRYGGTFVVGPARRQQVLADRAAKAKKGQPVTA